KPTVFIIPDGQQFHVRKGTVKKLKDKWFNDEFNVIGIPGRIISEELAKKTMRTDETIDWEKAYCFFNSYQWCSDIEMVRKHILGDDGKVMLFGGSGGGYLIHEYLTRYGDNVSRAFTYGAANPFLDAKLGIITDTFYEEIEAMGSDYQKKLRKVLKDFEKERPDLIMALSRQHYFLKAEELTKAREDLIDSLYNGNREYFEKIKKDYQVNAINDLMNSLQGVGIRVRIYEIIQPLLNTFNQFGERIYPTMEMSCHIAQPLIQLSNKGKIPEHTMDLSKLKDLDTEVFILTGYEDKAAGYKSSIELSKIFKYCTIFIADDDHMFKNLNEANLFNKTIITFFNYGLQSDKTKDLLKKLEPYRFKEHIQK
ncbi:unnamed protein product, partial [marine sediment metagenome]